MLLEPVWAESQVLHYLRHYRWVWCSMLPMTHDLLAVVSLGGRFAPEQICFAAEHICYALVQSKYALRSNKYALPQGKLVYTGDWNAPREASLPVTRQWALPVKPMPPTGQDRRQSHRTHIGGSASSHKARGPTEGTGSNMFSGEEGRPGIPSTSNILSIAAGDL